MTHIITKKW